MLTLRSTGIYVVRIATGLMKQACGDAPPGIAEVGGITISVGLALASGRDGEAGVPLKRVDHALRQAQHAGCNRVVKAPPPVQEAVLSD
ncbi:hypothetical protein GPA19_13080 [Azoarcus indigens]|uniref:Uncharacterized protein n=1 Tax=Azoarcus indigens TaxID=29545 RepID=A0A4R6DRL2_9RHOO|nr:hypothetical protein [Azoarcus indigens]NMG65879.1 hypothetical protein [Azoarcus indigens]TDN47731.1 hypothetical protein C7389_11840 [Azoarcus indigens]